MKKIFVLITLLLLGVAVDADPHCVVVVQSSRIVPYDDVVAGFESALTGAIHYEGPKRIHPVMFERYMLSEETAAALPRKIKAGNPSLIFAVGSGALSVAEGISGIPIVYCMVPDPRSIIGSRRDITGVGMQIAPERQLAVLTNTIAGIRRIGLVYNPARSGGLVQRAEAFARKQGLTLVVREAEHAKDVPAMVSSMEGRVDAFWMLPDATLLSPEIAEYLVLFSLETGIPVVTFSEKYLDAGAAVGVCFDVTALGRQAGRMVKRILGGAAVSDVPPEEPEEVDVRLNDKIFKKLGIAVKPAAVPER